MRKEESKFITGFISEAGTKSRNNDYFGFVQMENYGIWVIADGFDEEKGADVASRTAVESSIEYFMSYPRFNPEIIEEIMTYVNTKIKEKQEETENYSLMHTSLLIVISNYNSILYGNVGNTRLYHIRGGYIIYQSSDDSISQLLAEENVLSLGDMKYHRQRNDLLQAIGDYSKIKPNIIKKPVTLHEGDVLCLTTIGFWENIDENLMENELSRYEDRKEWMKSLEKKIMNTARNEVENYTFAAVTIEKVAPPEPVEKDRRKLYMKIVTAVFIVTVILLSVCIFNARRKSSIMKRISEYEQASEEEIVKKNFNNSIDELKLVIGEYEKMKPRSRGIIGFLLNSENSRKEMDKKIEDVRKRIETTEKIKKAFENISQGNDNFNKGKYDEASVKYQEAKFNLEQNTYMRDELNIEEIMITLRGRMESISKLKEAQVQEINGNTALISGNYTLAEESYKAASNIYMTNGKADYVPIIEGKIREIQAKQKSVHDGARLSENRGDMLSQTDSAKAKESYYEAREIYETLGDNMKVQEIDNKIEEINARMMSSLQEANNFVQEGLSQMTAKNPSGAISSLTRAKMIYQLMNDRNNADNVDRFISQAQESMKMNEEKENTMAIQQEKMMEYIREKELEIEEERQKREKISETMSRISNLEIAADELYALKRYPESIQKYNEIKETYEGLKSSGDMINQDLKIESLSRKIAGIEGLLYEEQGDSEMGKKNWKEAEEKYRKAIESMEISFIEKEYMQRVEKKLKKAMKKADKKWWQFWK